MQNQLTPHPSVSDRSRAWSEEQTLHVAAVVSNPQRWGTRLKLAHDFRRHMRASPNVRLHFIEMAYGDRPHELVRPHLHPDDHALRSVHEIFHKENLSNLAVQTFPDGWRYGAIIDADFSFCRWDWALATIHELQHYDWVQPFSTYQNLSGNLPGRAFQPVGDIGRSFAYTWHQNDHDLPPGWRQAEPYARRRGVGAPGGAWAFTRKAWDESGGLLDRCVLGSGDWFMAFGLVGERAPDKRYDGYSDAYVHYLDAALERYSACRKNIGYVDCHAFHGFHGAMRNRAYGSRDEILIANSFDPYKDVYPDWRGVLQVSPRKPELRDAIRRYFRERNEDDPALT